MEYKNIFHITSCFCLNKGNFAIHCILDKKAYAPGETAVITADINTKYLKTKINSM